MFYDNQCPKCRSKKLKPLDESVKYIFNSGKFVVFDSIDLLNNYYENINKKTVSFIKSLHEEYKNEEIEIVDISEILIETFQEKLKMNVKCEVCEEEFIIEIQMSMGYYFYDYFWKELKREIDLAIKEVALISLEEIDNLSQVHKIEIEIVNSFYNCDNEKYRYLKRLLDLTLEMPEEKGGEGDYVIQALIFSVTGALMYDLVKYGIINFIEKIKTVEYNRKIKKKIMKALANEDLDWVVRVLSDEELKRLLNMTNLPGLNNEKKKELVEKAFINKAESYKKELYDIITNKYYG